MKKIDRIIMNGLDELLERYSKLWDIDLDDLELGHSFWPIIPLV